MSKNGKEVLVGVLGMAGIIIGGIAILGVCVNALAHGLTQWVATQGGCGPQQFLSSIAGL